MFYFLIIRFHSHYESFKHYRSVLNKSENFISRSLTYHYSRVTTINNLITRLLDFFGFAHIYVYTKEQDHTIHNILQFAFIHQMLLKDFYTTTYKSTSYILMST